MCASATFEMFTIRSGALASSARRFMPCESVPSMRIARLFSFLFSRPLPWHLPHDLCFLIPRRRRRHHVRGHRRHPVRRPAGRELPVRGRPDQRRRRRRMGCPSRRHQVGFVAVQRRVLRRGARPVRSLRRPPGVHARRQRVDRLPPREQWRVQPARAVGEGARGRSSPYATRRSVRTRCG